MKVKRRINKIKKPTPARQSPGDKLMLPTEKTPIAASLSAYSTLLYGQEKVGKTSLAAQFPDALILEFEAGTKALSCYSMPVNSWVEFVKIIGLLSKPHQFGTVVIDTVDIAYQYCFEYVCSKLAITHPADLQWGKGWAEISKEFAKRINSLLKMETGTLFISHEQTKEVKTPLGKTYNRIEPSTNKQASELIKGLCDNIFYYRLIDVSTRQLLIRSDGLAIAGTRIDGFRDAETKEPIQHIDAGQTASECFHNLTVAFNNKYSIPRKTGGDGGKKSSS